MNGPPRHGPLSALREPDTLLALEDGTVFFGYACGAQGESAGEIVFNTSMTGYPEIITDPSYRGQIVTFTYPLIGNYGVNSADAESAKPQLSAVVVRSICDRPSNWRSRETLPDYLRRHRVVAIEGIDTRSLTRRLRSAGVMRAIVSTRDLDPESLVAKARASAGLVGRDLVAEVSPLDVTPWLEPTGAPTAKADVVAEQIGNGDKNVDAAALAVEAAIHARQTGRPMELTAVPATVQAPKMKPVKAPRIAVLHCGMKANIAEELRKRGAEVRLYPASTSIATILAEKPDGILLSNGPGDPEGVVGVVDGVREAIGQVPIFGICLGIQMLALAFGARTYKLKFGHRGANQPVVDLTTGRIEITSQNHGFAVDAESLKPTSDEDLRNGLNVTHRNLSDETIEGFEHPELGVMAVQYHPEAAPGPHDAAYLFDRFLERVRRHRAGALEPAVPAGRKG